MYINEENVLRLYKYVLSCMDLKPVNLYAFFASML